MSVLMTFDFQFPVDPFGEMAGVRHGHDIGPSEDAIEIYVPTQEGGTKTVWWIDLQNAKELKTALGCAIAAMEANA
jgi:hypothetical protein